MIARSLLRTLEIVVTLGRRMVQIPSLDCLPFAVCETGPHTCLLCANVSRTSGRRGHNVFDKKPLLRALRDLSLTLFIVNKCLKILSRLADPSIIEWDAAHTALTRVFPEEESFD